MSTKRPAGAKPRDPEGSKAAILETARLCFTEASFDRVGLRTIGERAGVDPALIVHYFGSKERLFAAAVTAELDVAAFFDRGVPASRRLAEYALGRRSTTAAEAFDPMVALLRSASSPVATRVFRDLIETLVRRPLADTLGPPDGGDRAALVAAFILGIKLLRDVLGDPVLAGHASATAQAAEHAFAALLRRPRKRKSAAAGGTGRASLRRAGPKRS